MICDLCGEREAILFIEQANGNGKQKLNLCYECARAYGVSPDSKAIGRQLALLFESLLRKKVVNPDSQKLCPVCGTSLADIKTTRRVGCPECYSIFKNEIGQIFKNIGVKGPYTGTMPKRLKNFHSVLNDRIVLKSKLEESIKKEDYEKAAIYRDYLKALEKSPVSGGDNE